MTEKQSVIYTEINVENMKYIRLVDKTIFDTYLGYTKIKKSINYMHFLFSKKTFIRVVWIGMLFWGNSAPMMAIHKEKEINLSGLWHVTYQQSKVFPINLPGTLTDAHLGDSCMLRPKMEREVFLNLKAKYCYVGPAVYFKTVRVPKDWKHQRIILHFDRTLWTSQLRVNGRKLENITNESLSTPHEFDITDYVAFGAENELEITIDNSKRYDISTKELAHSYTNETQTKWNGILGNIVLQAKPQTYIRNVALYPQAQNGRVHVQINLQETLRKTSVKRQKPYGQIHFTIHSPKGNVVKDTLLACEGPVVRFDSRVDNVELWDEFAPNVYTARVEYVEKKQRDVQEVLFGFRSLTNNKALLHVNGRRLFLRGTLENCVFPLKGYPAMDETSWKAIFEKAKSYGLNHLRFHSWCPPEAAFTVADKMGFYLQIELPVWSLTIGKDKETLRFLRQEADRILLTYGNHPSFCFLSLGNELQKDFNALDELLMHVKRDSRRLYTTTTFTFERGHGRWPEPHDDFWVSQWSKRGWLRGQGVFKDHPVSFKQDYSAMIDSLPVPVVTHEIGQYSVYPNITSIGKYTGNLMPLSLQAIHNDLAQKGKLDKAPMYLEASTRFASILYKEEIERALKTTGYSGFQLLGLTDYPGQGTALVGLVDVFWDGKDSVADAQFKQACSSIVPLASYDRATYLNSDMFEVTFQVANYSDTELKNIALQWTLLRSDGTVYAEGCLDKQNVEVGAGQVLGKISVPLTAIETAEKLTLRSTLSGCGRTNQWNIWVYPSRLELSEGNVFVTTDIKKAEEALLKGKTVLLHLPQDNIKGLEGKFLPVFWSPVHFPNQPGTMGVLCNPCHPALKNFPTEQHSNWQWWDLCKHSKTMQLDSIENQIDVIVSMMDNFYKNRNLGIVFETAVYSGKLVVCSMDLSNVETRPVAKQMLYSLLQYMKSSAFHPSRKADFSLLKKCIYSPSRVELDKKSIYD